MSFPLNLNITFASSFVLKQVSRKESWEPAAESCFSKYLHLLLLLFLLKNEQVFTVKAEHKDALESTRRILADIQTRQIEANGDGGFFSAAVPEKTAETFSFSSFFSQLIQSNMSIELEKHAMSEVMKANIKWHDSKQSGLCYDVNQVKQFVENYFEWNQGVFTDGSELDNICVGLTAILEYLSAEILELSSYHTKGEAMTLEALRKGISGDPALMALPYTHIFFEE